MRRALDLLGATEEDGKTTLAIGQQWRFTSTTRGRMFYAVFKRNCRLVECHLKDQPDRTAEAERARELEPTSAV